MTVDLDALEAAYPWGEPTTKQHDAGVAFWFDGERSAEDLPRTHWRTVMTDTKAFEAVLAKARGHILDELTPLLPHRRTEDWGAIFDAITAGMSIDLPALIAEHRAALARVEQLEGALGWFLTDERFIVSVGGNPNVVDQMLSQARAALALKQ